MSNNEPTVLVVDDQPINTKLLQRRLEREKMRVLTAGDGHECLAIVQREIPDLILLDVMMPEMDGIETCRHLKADAATAEIPIIFITARTSQENKIEGLEIGAADYITKPIDLDETLARVNTQLRIQRAHRENLELQQRLSDTRRAAAIGSITQGISHNLNNLLGVVVGYLDLLKQAGDNEQLAQRSLDSMDKAIRRMVTLIRELSRIASEESVPRTACDLGKLIEHSIERFQREYERKETVLIQNNFDADYRFETNPESFETILGRLFVNAAEACEESEREAEISIRLEEKRYHGIAHLVIHVTDNGVGIDEQIRDTLFEPFVSTQTNVGRGLGLTMVRHMVRSLQGHIEIESSRGQGTTVTLELPCEQLEQFEEREEQVRLS